MSFFGYMNAPISIPPVFDTTPCLEHLMEYEDWVIDTGVNKLNFFMPAWPTLYPGIVDGEENIKSGYRAQDIITNPKEMPIDQALNNALTERQKQLLYECEEERMVVKACFRDFIKLKRTAKHTSWDTAEAANLAFF